MHGGVNFPHTLLQNVVCHQGRSSRSAASMQSLAPGWTQLQDQPNLNGICFEALSAANNIRRHVHQTPVEPSPWLGGGVMQVHLKLESEQRTGSFKARGAVNKILSIPPHQLSKGLVTSSTGNHALAFLHACKVLRQQHPEITIPRPRVYLPSTASQFKIAKLRSQDIADLILYGTDCVEAELEAARVAADTGATYVSPYNDLQVIAGQGTISLDLMAQLPRAAVDVVFVPVGGGGLISGMAAVLKAADPSIWVVGCQPAASDVMRQSVAAGCVVEAESGETLSDATAGGIESGSLTLQPCIDYVDEWVTLDEEEIGQAVVGMITHHSKLIEGAAGCAVAACLKKREELKGKSAVVLCCGGNMAVPTLRALLDKHAPRG